MINDSQDSNFEFGQASLKHLSETRKWTMLLSIGGFVFIGLMILVFIIASTTAGMMSPSNGFSMLTMLPLLVILVVYFFPIYYLFQFSRISKEAIATKDSSLMSKAFEFLKFHYRFMGILFIVVVSIYLLIALIMLISGSLFNLF